MGALVREASGPFVLYEARTLEEIAAIRSAALIAPEHIIPFPTIVLDLRESADFRAGRVVPLPQGAGAATSSFATSRACSSASAKRSARCSRRAKSSSMRAHHELERESERPLVLAIGFFDGFHRGHREIARQTLRCASRAGAPACSRFESSGDALCARDRAAVALHAARNVCELFADAGFEECFLVQFDERLATLTPEAFLDC